MELSEFIILAGPKNLSKVGGFSPQHLSRLKKGHIRMTDLNRSGLINAVKSEKGQFKNYNELKLVVSGKDKLVQSNFKGYESDKKTDSDN